MAAPPSGEPDHLKHQPLLVARVFPESRGIGSSSDLVKDVGSSAVNSRQ